MGARYHLDTQRLKKLSQLKKSKSITAKQLKELEIMKAQEDIALQSMDHEKMKKIYDYLEELNQLNRTTASDKARLMILKERLGNYK